MTHSFVRGCTVFLLAFVSCSWAKAQEEAPAAPPVYREVRVQVLGLHGQPAANRAVRLYGISRDSMRPDGDEGRLFPEWDFVTDAHGRLTFKLGEYQTEAQPIPGWGVYGIHVEAGPNDAGAFSPYLVNFKASDLKSELNARNSREWGRALGLTKANLNLTVRIREGFTIRGRLLGYPTGEPRANLEVSAHYDLHADTHNGTGGEVTGPAAKSDARGRFTLKHVYPSTAYLALADGEGTWLKTKRNGGAWKFDALDEIERPKGMTTSVEIMLAEGNRFRYSGRVVNAAREPIAGALVAFGISHHRHPQNAEDEHTFLHTVTDENGRYEIRAETPWSRGMYVEKDGYVRSDQFHDFEDESPFPPGRYDFTLKRAP